MGSSSNKPPQIYNIMKGTKLGERRWVLLGKCLAPKCLATLLGIRSDRFKTAGSGHLDRRYRCFGAVAQQELAEQRVDVLDRDSLMSFLLQVRKRAPIKYWRIDQFFLRLYINQASMLPTKLPSSFNSLARLSA